MSTFLGNYTLFARTSYAWKMGVGGILPDLIYLAGFLPNLFAYRSFSEWMRDPLWDELWNSTAANHL